MLLLRILNNTQQLCTTIITLSPSVVALLILSLLASSVIHGVVSQQVAVTEHYEIANNDSQGLLLNIQSLYNITQGPSHGNVSQFMESYVLYEPQKNYQGYDTIVYNQTATTMVIANITIFEPCVTAHRYKGQWGVLYNIPMPYVTLVESNFNISLAYIRENFTYYIDLCRDGNSTCAYGRFFTTNETSSTTLLQLPPAWLSSAPTATFPNALRHPEYGAYYSMYSESASVWFASASNCSAVNVQSQFSFDRLLSCRTKTSPYVHCVNVSTVQDTPFIDYSGALFIRAYQNGVDLLRSWEYPFVHRFYAYTNVIADVRTQGKVAFVVSSFISSGPVLVIKIKTTTVDASSYLTNPVFNNTELVHSSESFNIQQQQVQRWEFRSISARDSFSGEFSFSWTLNPDGSNVGVIVQIALANQPTVSQNYKLNTAVKIYKDSAFTTASSGPFQSTDVIYIASMYEGSNKLYDVKISNVWLCYPRLPGVVPQYDPVKSLYGCKQASAIVPNDNILHLVKDGNIVIDTNGNRWQITTHPNITVEGKSAMGIGVQFSSTALEDRIYYVHVESLLTPKEQRPSPQKRKDKHNYVTMTTSLLSSAWSNSADDEAIAVDMRAFYVSREERFQELSKQNAVLSVMIGLIASLVVVMITCSVIYCTVGACVHKAKQRKRKTLERIEREKRLAELNTQLKRHSMYLKIKDSSFENINDVLEDRNMIERFASFCQKIQCQEPLTFYLAAKNYQSMPVGEEKDNAFATLYRDFIAQGSPYELNIPDKMRKNAPMLLDEIIDLVVLEMNQNSFGRFRDELKEELCVR